MMSQTLCEALVQAWKDSQKSKRNRVIKDLIAHNDYCRKIGRIISYFAQKKYHQQIFQFFHLRETKAPVELNCVTLIVESGIGNLNFFKSS